MASRASFHVRALAEGFTWLTHLQAAWLALIGLILAAGFVVPAAIHGPVWVGALVLAAMVLLGYAEGAFRAWGPSEEVELGAGGSATAAAPVSIHAEPGSKVTVGDVSVGSQAQVAAPAEDQPPEASG